MNAREVSAWAGRATATAQTLMLAWLVLGTRLSRPGGLAMVLVGAGVSLGVWAIGSMGVRRLSMWPEPRSDAELIRHGPYAWVRHPMYAAVLLGAGGLVVQTTSAARLGGLAALAAVLAVKMRLEEAHMRRRFPDYEVYARQTSRLIPFLY